MSIATQASEVYARSIDKVLGPLCQGIDATAGMVAFADGTVHHLAISWALRVTCPDAVYSLEIGIVGSTVVLTIDDTHRHIVLAVSKPQQEGYAPDETRQVDSMGSSRRRQVTHGLGTTSAFARGRSNAARVA
jgi:hypothetical protein